MNNDLICARCGNETFRGHLVEGKGPALECAECGQHGATTKSELEPSYWFWCMDCKEDSTHKKRRDAERLYDKHCSDGCERVMVLER